MSSARRRNESSSGLLTKAAGALQTRTSKVDSAVSKAVGSKKTGPAKPKGRKPAAKKKNTTRIVKKGPNSFAQY